MFLCVRSDLIFPLAAEIKISYEAQMVKDQAVGRKMVESKKSQNRENKSNRSKDEATPILQKNTICIEWEHSYFTCFEGIQLFEVFPLFWCCGVVIILICLGILKCSPLFYSAQ